MMMPKFHIGGAEVQVLNLLKNLDTESFSVSLCLLNRGDIEMENEARKYVDSVFFLGFRWRNFPWSFLKLVKYLQDGRFGVVHAHLQYANLIGRLAGWFAGVPVRMTTEHGMNLWKSKLLLAIERVMNRITDVKICVSHDIMEIRHRKEGTPDNKLFYIPNAVDPDLFGEDPDSKERIMAEFGWDDEDLLILSLGRVVEVKNYPLLVEAVVELNNKMPGVRCLIAGDGDRKKEVQAKIDDLGAGDNIKMAGERRDIAALLAAADLFALSSFREGLPVSILEAMAAGVPVVSTDVGGVGEAVTGGETGLLVPSGDAEAMASAFEQILTDTPLRMSLTNNASKTVNERFSMNSVAKKLGDIYVKLVREKENTT